MSLSADIIKARSTKLHENVIYAFKVKQFIKELKERCDISVDGHGDHCGLFEHDIDELAGERLI